jgi:hypothetical protein
MSFNAGFPRRELEAVRSNTSSMICENSAYGREVKYRCLCEQGTL